MNSKRSNSATGPTLLVITIDAQEDESLSSTPLCRSSYHDGSYTSRCLSSQQTFVAVTALQKILSSRGVPCTFFVSDAVSRNSETAALFRSLAVNPNTEIGALLLPGNTPPFSLTSVCDTEEIRQIRRMCCNLPVSLLRRKLQTLTRSIEKNIQVKPTSFRAGHWSFCPELAGCLIDNGYVVDSSITPGVEHRSSFGPDYSAMPYFDFAHDIDELIPVKLAQHARHHRLIEIPPSIYTAMQPLELQHGVKSLGSRLYNRLARRRQGRAPVAGTWLSPDKYSIAEMIGMVDHLLERNVRVLNMTLNTNFASNGPEFFEDYLEKVLYVTDYIIKQHCRPVTISDAAGILAARQTERFQFSDDLPLAEGDIHW